MSTTSTPPRTEPHGYDDDPGASEAPTDVDTSYGESRGRATRRSTSRGGSSMGSGGDVARRLVDADAEAAIIATVLTTPQVFDDIADVLSPQMFATPMCAHLWEAIITCDANGRGFDLITVCDELRRTKQLGGVGGRVGIDALVAGATQVGNLTSWVTIVADHARMRTMLAASREVAAMVLDPSSDVTDVIAEAERLLLDAGSVGGDEGPIGLTQALTETLAAITAASNRDLLGQSSGFADLDRMTGGFQGGQLIVVAARPAMGKSAFALGLACHVAATCGGNVAFLSYEMSRQELTTRLLSTETGVNMLSVRSGKMPPGTDHKLALAAERLAVLPLLIDDRPPESITKLRSAMRRLARRVDLKFIVVDYLQLMVGDRRRSDDNRNNEVATISRGLKALARELNITIVALSQLSRGLESRVDKRPMLSDLRDSGAIEQDADVVLFLYRDSMYNASAEPTSAELIVSKQRQGPTGKVWLYFDDSTAHFANGTPPSWGANAGDTGGGLVSVPAGGPRFGARASSPF